MDPLLVAPSTPPQHSIDASSASISTGRISVEINIDEGGLELGQAFVAACQQLHESQLAAASTAGTAAEAAVVVYRPRLSCPTGLMMAGGLDDGWRSLR